MYVFFDTEFSNLFADADLVSIGMVAQSGETFYAESNEADMAFASEFVLEVVAPLLDAPARFTLDEIGQQATAWLAQFGSVTLLTDSPDYDWRFVQRIFRNVGWPANLRHHPGNLNSVMAPAVDQFYQNAVARHQKTLRVHHALDDALANLRAYQDTRLAKPTWRPKF